MDITIRKGIHEDRMLDIEFNDKNPRCLNYPDGSAALHFIEVENNPTSSLPRRSIWLTLDFSKDEIEKLSSLIKR